MIETVGKKKWSLWSVEPKIPTFPIAVVSELKICLKNKKCYLKVIYFLCQDEIITEEMKKKKEQKACFYFKVARYGYDLK